MKSFSFAGAKSIGIANLVEQAWREMSTAPDKAQDNTVSLWKRRKSKAKLRVDEDQMRTILQRRIEQ